MIDGCNLRLNEFIHEHDQMREVIRRFDEVMSDKVNKITLFSFQKEVYEDFVKVLDW